MSPAHPSRLTRRRPQRRTLGIGLIVLCQSQQSLALGALALFLPLIRKDLGLSFTEAGTLATASMLTYALMQVPAGYLADRFGPRRLFLGGLVGVCLLFGLLPALDSPVLLFTNQALSGVLRALVFAPGLLLISAQFPPGRRATAMGLYVAGGFSSNIVVAALGPPLVDAIGWRATFVLLSAVGLVVIAAYWRLGDRDPRPAGTDTVRLGELVALLRGPLMWVAGAQQFIRLGVAASMSFWLPTLLIDDKGFSLGAAGLVVALGAILMAPANVGGGYLSDRLGRPVAVISVSVSVLAGSLALLATVESPVLIVAVVAMQSIFVQLYFGPLFALPVRVLGNRKAGVISGFSNLAATLGGVSSTYALGALADATGSFDAGLYVLSGLCLVGVATSTVLARLSRLPERESNS